jgi:hydrogenase nickel incorporation protein HypA/HybF
MHELSLSKATYKSILEILKQKNKTLNELKEVILAIGEIQNIDIDIFLQSLQEYLLNIKISYKIIKAKIRCNKCLNEWYYSDSLNILNEDQKESIHFIPETIYLFIRCNKCNSNDFEIIDGRGIFILELMF